MNYIERVPRKFQVIFDPAKLAHLVQNYLLKQTFLIKHHEKNATIKINAARSDLELEVTSEEVLTEAIIFYKVLKKFMEITAVVSGTNGPSGYIITVREIRIAIDDRSYARPNISPDLAWINNIRASKNTINATLMNIPTSVKINFTTYEQQLAHLADEVKIRIFDRADEKLELVRKTGKVFFIENTQDVLSYIPEDEEMFINYRDHIHVDIEEVINGYKDKKIVSELIVPVIYVGHDGKDVSLGYIQLISKSKPIDMMQILDIKAKTFEMVDRIRDSNTVIINHKQELLNISKTGLRALITDPELKEFLLHRSGFSFDIIFKLQQPITVYTEIVYTALNSEGDLILGVRFLGKSSRQGEWDRLMTFIETLEKKGSIV